MKKALSPKEIFARTMLYLVVSLICIFILYPYFLINITFCHNNTSWQSCHNLYIFLL